MGNTPEGAKKAVATMKAKYGEDFFKLRAKRAGEGNKGKGGKHQFKKGDQRAKDAGLKGAAKKWKS